MPRRIILTLSLFCAYFVTVATVANAEDKPGPKAEEFARVHGELSAVLAEMAELKIRYRTANDEKRQEILQRWKEQIAKGEEIGPRMLKAGIEAYAEAPNADPKLSEYLVNQLALTARRDDFEPAYRVGKLLMDNNCPSKRIPLLAGLAALAVSQYDDAERYLKKAATTGEPFSLGRDRESLEGLIRMFVSHPDYFKQAWAKEQKIRQREAETNSLPRVLLKTTQGDIVVELFENDAPNTVANFISLVERDFYKDLTFHRVLAGFVAQGGDPRGNGTGGPGYSIPCECQNPNHRNHFRGSLSMAHAGRDTGGSQFFITFVPAPSLDGKHTVFGRVVSGWDVLAKLKRRDPNDKEAQRADKILEAKVLRKRPHKYKPVKMPE